MFNIFFSLFEVCLALKWHLTGELVPQALHLHKPNPNGCVAKVDGNTH